MANSATWAIFRSTRSHVPRPGREATEPTRTRRSRPPRRRPAARGTASGSRASGHDRLAAPNRRAEREPGASPGRSRRCEGRCLAPRRHWLRPGRRREGSPESEDLPSPDQRQLLAEGGIVLRRLVLSALVALLVVALCARARSPACASRARTQTIFGAAQPRVLATNAIDALDAASRAGEFYYHVTSTSFGPYVDQVGRLGAGRHERLGVQGERRVAARRRGSGRRSRPATSCSGTTRASPSRAARRRSSFAASPAVATRSPPVTTPGRRFRRPERCCASTAAASRRRAPAPARARTGARAGDAPGMIRSNAVA